MKILIVEDELETIDSLKSYLTNIGYRVDISLSGQDALKLIKQNEYSLIILDLNLPDLSGEIVCQKIRHLGKNTPILIISGDNQVVRKTALLNSGADDYLEKPFSPEELVARLKALLRRPTNLRSNLFKLRNLEVDRFKKVVRLNKQELDLTRKEFLILEYLTNNPSCLVSREELIDQVWGEEADYFSNTIETHMMNIRKKLNKTTNKPFIKTVFGRGYKIS